MLKKILVVDDEPVVVTLLKSRIESRGFKVEIATEGASAIEKAKEWRPDLILLDIVMPGMDGFEICRRLKATKELAAIPVVLFTAS
ncbi:MAG: response regulator, partial [Candidatus Omnitrophota bacterium]